MWVEQDPKQAARCLGGAVIVGREGRRGVMVATVMPTPGLYPGFTPRTAAGLDFALL
jgi:hypothetical protein